MSDSDKYEPLRNWVENILGNFLYEAYQIFETIDYVLILIILLITILISFSQIKQYFKFRNEKSHKLYITKIVLIIRILLIWSILFSLPLFINDINNLYVFPESYLGFNIMGNLSLEVCSVNNFMANFFCEQTQSLKISGLEFVIRNIIFFLNLGMIILGFVIKSFLTFFSVLTFQLLSIKLFDFIHKYWNGENKKTIQEVLLFIVSLIGVVILNYYINNFSLEFIPKLSENVKIDGLILYAIIYLFQYILFLIVFIGNLIFINTKIFEGIASLEIKGILRHYVILIISMAIISQKFILFMDDYPDIINWGIGTVLLMALLSITILETGVVNKIKTTINDIKNG